MPRCVHADQETVMERTEDHIDDELIDLGAVSVETQGMFPRYPELGVGDAMPPGLSPD